MNGKSKSDEAMAEDLSALHAEIARLRADLVRLVETVASMGRERAAAFGGAAKVSEGLAAGEDALGDLQAKLAEVEREVSASTRRSPWRALGIAAGIGFLAGLLLRR